MELDPATALLTIGAFVGGQVVIAIIGEWRAGRDGERQREARREEREHQQARELAKSRRDFHQSYIDASRKTYLALCDIARMFAGGHREEALRLGRDLSLGEILAKSDGTLVTIDGDPTPLIAFAHMLRDVAEHVDDVPDPARQQRVNDVAALIAGAFFAQELRLANQEEPARITDRGVVSRLQAAAESMREALARGR